MRLCCAPGAKPLTGNNKQHQRFTDSLGFKSSPGFDSFKEDGCWVYAANFSLPPYSPFCQTVIMFVIVLSFLMSKRITNNSVKAKGRIKANVAFGQGYS